jgi:hypothetical protein
MSMTAGVALAAAVLFALAMALLPRWLIRRGQDRLAREILESGDGQGRFELLTRAGRLASAYRRVPGVLGLRGGELEFQSRFEPPLSIPLSGIRKISSGKLLSTGRRLWRDEVLAITDSSGALVEFQMSHASCFHWRQALGVWAARQKQG